MSVSASTKPYLIRALHEWCVDQGFTPYLAVKVDPRTRVPAAFVRDGQIVLNLALHATHQLQITNSEITCQARFGGVAHTLYVPIECVVAIYARENGEGMFFEVPTLTESAESGSLQAESTDAIADATTAPTSPPSTAGKSHLRVIK